MGNCLKTQLKEAVQNDSLPIYGESYFEFVANENAGNTAFGGIIEVQSPIKLKAEGTYFTDNQQQANLGTEIMYDGSNSFFVKKPITGSVKVKISNKYVITQFRAIYDGIIGTTLKLNNDTLRYSVDTEIINLNLGDYTEINPEDCLAKLVKLREFEWRAFNGSFLVNDLAENQIANGRDYTTYPNLKLYIHKSKNKYFNGTEIKPIPSSIIYIVFKESGYELHQDTADGTLLYDSLA